MPNCDVLYRLIKGFWVNNLSPKEGNNQSWITSLIIQGVSAKASFIKCTVKRLLSWVLEMTPCHLLPASGQANTRSQMNWLQCLHLAARAPVEGDVQFPLQLRNGPKRHSLWLSGLLRAEDMELCSNNSRREGTGNFLSDRQLLCLLTYAPGPPFIDPWSCSTALCRPDQGA